MAVRPAYGFPVRRSFIPSVGLASSLGAILENRELQEKSGTQISTKDIKIANDAKKTVVASGSKAVNTISVPAASINVVVAAPLQPVQVPPVVEPTK